MSWYWDKFDICPGAEVRKDFIVTPIASSQHRHDAKHQRVRAIGGVCL
jgi:hypothetical protein